MSATGLDVFDTTLQKTNEWLQDHAGTRDREPAAGLSRFARHFTHAWRASAIGGNGRQWCI